MREEVICIGGVHCHGSEPTKSAIRRTDALRRRMVSLEKFCASCARRHPVSTSLRNASGSGPRPPPADTPTDPSNRSTETSLECIFCILDAESATCSGKDAGQVGAGQSIPGDRAERCAVGSPTWRRRVNRIARQPVRVTGGEYQVWRYSHATRITNLLLDIMWLIGKLRRVALGARTRLCCPLSVSLSDPELVESNPGKPESCPASHLRSGTI